MKEIYLLQLLVLHFFADFIMQTNAQATGKSKRWKPLLTHTGSYATIFLFGLLWPLGSSALLFAVITFVAHTATDYVTSRLSRPLFEKGDYHNGFVVIGFDQMLHYIQLYLTLKLLL